MTVNLWQDIVVQSYKHNTKLHRIWAQATVIDTLDDHIVIANYRTKVIEANGRFWYTKEPSVTWFFKERWFNIIGIIRPTGIFYYCNIASPYMIDDEALKYIDYDLDVKVNPDYTYTTLDRKEYNKHKVKMEYPASIRTILENELEALKAMIELRKGPFKENVVNDYFNKYMHHYEQE
ncbi:MAG: DUF402 domain-containing protein [Candidatus Izemoplasmataceae bacterium]